MSRAKKTPPVQMIQESEKIGCTYSSLEEVIEQFERFKKTISPEVLGVGTSFEICSEYGSDSVNLVVSWSRPKTPEEIERDKENEEYSRRLKLNQYERLKKELGL